MANKITYDRFDIVFQEIPDEVTLAFTIEGCPNRCKGCHSPHLREQNGPELTLKKLTNIIKSYGTSITCVLFLGGDAFHKELIPLIKEINRLGKKSAFYSGNDSMNCELAEILNFYKFGCYCEELGGLTSTATNQKLLKIEDITYKFWNDNE